MNSVIIGSGIGEGKIHSTFSELSGVLRSLRQDGGLAEVLSHVFAASYMRRLQACGIFLKPVANLRVSPIRHLLC
jgi:hypothetical protein